MTRHITATMVIRKVIEIEDTCGCIKNMDEFVNALAVADFDENDVGTESGTVLGLNVEKMSDDYYIVWGED